VTATEPRAAEAVEPPRPLLPQRLSPRKEEILDALEAIVLREGFRALRVTDVAAQLNASYATLYSIAPTKEELVLLVVDRWYARAVRHGQQALAGVEGPVARLETWVGFGVAGTQATSEQFWADIATHAGLNQLIDAYSHYYVLVLEALLNEGVEAGVFRPINTHAVAIYWEAAAASLRDTNYVRHLQGIPIAEMSALWVDLVLHGILRD
jgi:AcrR family transcriptional regulator